jgi:hypothetical protein
MPKVPERGGCTRRASKPSIELKAVTIVRVASIARGARSAVLLSGKTAMRRARALAGRWTARKNDKASVIAIAFFTIVEPHCKEQPVETDSSVDRFRDRGVATCFAPPSVAPAGLIQVTRGEYGGQQTRRSNMIVSGTGEPSLSLVKVTKRHPRVFIKRAILDLKWTGQRFRWPKINIRDRSSTEAPSSSDEPASRTDALLHERFRRERPCNSHARPEGAAFWSFPYDL